MVVKTISQLKQAVENCGNPFKVGDLVECVGVDRNPPAQHFIGINLSKKVLITPEVGIEKVADYCGNEVWDIPSEFKPVVIPNLVRIKKVGDNWKKVRAYIGGGYIPYVIYEIGEKLETIPYVVIVPYYISDNKSEKLITALSSCQTKVESEVRLGVSIYKPLPTDKKGIYELKEVELPTQEFTFDIPIEYYDFSEILTVKAEIPNLPDLKKEFGFKLGGLIKKVLIHAIAGEQILKEYRTIIKLPNNIVIGIEDNYDPINDKYNKYYFIGYEMKGFTKFAVNLYKGKYASNFVDAIKNARIPTKLVVDNKYLIVYNDRLGVILPTPKLIRELNEKYKYQFNFDECVDEYFLYREFNDPINVLMTPNLNEVINKFNKQIEKLLDSCMVVEPEKLEKVLEEFGNTEITEEDLKPFGLNLNKLKEELEQFRYDGKQPPTLADLWNLVKGGFTKNYHSFRLAFLNKVRKILNEKFGENYHTL